MFLYKYLLEQEAFFEWYYISLDIHCNKKVDPCFFVFWMSLISSLHNIKLTHVELAPPALYFQFRDDLNT